MNKEAARLHLRRGQVAEATRHFEKAVSLMETDVHAWAMLVTCYHSLGRAKDLQVAAKMVVAEAEKILAQDPSNGAALSFGASGLAALGQVDNAKEWMERAMLIDADNLDMRYNFACALASFLDDRDAALRLLERNFAAVGAYQIRVAETDPDLDSLRLDPRFQAMLSKARKRLGIADEIEPGRGTEKAPSARPAEASVQPAP